MGAIHPVTTQDRILVEQMVTNEAKSLFLGYVLLFFLGAFGAHRFYMGAWPGGLLQLVSCIVGLVFLLQGSAVGLMILAALGLLLFFDIFFLPGLSSEQKERTRRSLIRQLERGYQI